MAILPSSSEILKEFRWNEGWLTEGNSRNRAGTRSSFISQVPVLITTLSFDPPEGGVVGVPVDEDERLGVGGEHLPSRFEARGVGRADGGNGVEYVEPYERPPDVTVKNEERYRHEQEDDDHAGVDGAYHSQDGASEP